MYNLPRWKSLNCLTLHVQVVESCRIVTQVKDVQEYTIKKSKLWCTRPKTAPIESSALFDVLALDSFSSIEALISIKKQPKIYTGHNRASL